MKLISLALAVLLILCGCAINPEPEHIPPATDPVPATEPVGIYDEASEIEAYTGGAIQAYPLSRSDATEIAFIGSDILLFSGRHATTLTRYTGVDLRICASVSLDCKISASDAAVQICEEGITYYNPQQKELVFLDGMLKEVRRILLPKTIYGSPALGTDRRTLYYSTARTLRCMDLETGLDRLLAEMHAVTLSPVALHCSDGILQCDSMDDHANAAQLYISTETGQILYESPEDVALQTHGSSYFASCMDGIYTELLIGSSEHGPTLLTPHTYGSRVFPLLQSGGAVLATGGEASASTQLDYYDLQSGTRTGNIALRGNETIRSPIIHGNPKHIWFLRYDSGYSSDVLCRWDLKKSEINDPRNCLSSRYSAEHPDLAGLAVCREIADNLSRRFGVQISLWTDAISFQPWDYTLIPEYQVPVIREKLNELEQFLALYPSGFLMKAAQLTTSGHIQICLVRSILSNEVSPTAVTEAAGLQYWDQNRNAYLCLSMQPESLVPYACHELSHIIDSRVLTVCRAYDDWNSLNPSGFRYTQGDPDALPADAQQWIAGTERAFIDLYSMTYPKEDRARILEYAITDGNSSCFESETMQKKLRQLCLGIREAFDLKASPEIFPWEQYLKQPLNQT